MRKSSLDGIRQSIGCPCFEFAEDSFDLRPEFLSRVQIRAVRWRVKTVYELSKARCKKQRAFAYQNGGSHLESNWKFQRGDIYFVKLEAGVGSEQNGARPAVILQNDVGNIYSPTLIVAALTSKTDKKVTQATHCQVEEDGLKPSIVQAEQIFTIDKSRVLKFVGHLSPENMRRVDDAVKISLALNPMGSIQKLKPIIRSQAAYPWEVAACRQRLLRTLRCKAGTDQQP